jgi:DegV family protein with EDD domain
MKMEINMSRIAVITDSNSGITQKAGKELGIKVIPMPFFIDGKQYYEDIDLTQEQFYEKLKSDAEISTSQPSVGELQAAYDEMLKTNDEVVYIPMSSGLSSTCQTASMVAEDYNGKVCVVNNQRISVTQRQAVLDAVALADKGYDAAKIKEILEREKFSSSIYITLDTLKYLKKGGRITPAAAAIGTVLKLNPVLQIQGEKLDAYAKARGKASAKKIMLKAMDDDLNGRFAEAYAKRQVYMEAAYAGNPEEAEEWAAVIKEHYPDLDFNMNALSLSVSCHIGHGALAIACSTYVPELVEDNYGKAKK